MRNEATLTSKLRSIEALRNQGIDVTRHSFFELTFSQAGIVLAEADVCKYRKPRNASGSRARYFYDHLARIANRKEH